MDIIVVLQVGLGVPTLDPVDRQSTTPRRPARTLYLAPVPHERLESPPLWYQYLPRG